MLEINRVYVDGFANVDRVDLSLYDLTALLATNNYGKSNVLIALSFAFDFISANTKQKLYMLSYRRGTPQNIHNPLRNFRFEMDFSYDNDGSSTNGKYAFEFEWKVNKDSGGIVEETLDMLEVGSSQKYTSFIKRNKDEAKYKTAPTGRASKETPIEKHELLLNKLSAYDELFYNPILKAICSLVFFVDKSFDADSQFNFSPFVFKTPEHGILSNQDTIGHTMYMLKQENEGKYCLILNTMKDLFPFIQDIDVKAASLNDDKKINIDLGEDSPIVAASTFYSLRIKTDYFDRFVDFSYMSDGMKRILLLLVKMAFADLEGVPLIGIEEPENSIHPGLFRKYLQIIGGFLNNSKVIVTSHSPFLINNIDLSHLYVGLPNPEGMARFKRISENGAKRINDYASDSGMESGTFIFSALNGDDEFDLSILQKNLVRD